MYGEKFGQRRLDVTGFIDGAALNDGRLAVPMPWQPEARQRPRQHREGADCGELPEHIHSCQFTTRTIAVWRTRSFAKNDRKPRYARLDNWYCADKPSSNGPGHLYGLTRIPRG